MTTEQIIKEQRAELRAMTTDQRKSEAARMTRLYFLASKREGAPSPQRWRQVYDAALAYTLKL